jgi:glycosyltransferase involved in cell wall biosynthesis
LEGRRDEIQNGKYPKNHLWGIDAIEEFNSWDARVLFTQSFKIPRLLESLLNRSLFRGSPGAKVELSVLKASKHADLIYSVCGPLTLSKLYPKKLVSWTFRNPIIQNKGIKLAHQAYKPRNLSANAGFLCLTPTAEKKFRKFAPSKFLPWSVDLEMFRPLKETYPLKKPFFFASGKTERDYETLVKAAPMVDAEIRIIGPSHLKPLNIPSNINWINTSYDPPDKAIDYHNLRNWYDQAIAVCIPLSGDADDTCGYTNMLEGMAMSKPVLMTHSGCLHIEPERENFGYSINPRDPKDWSEKMNLILSDQALAKKLGENGRKIAVENFSSKSFNNNIISFIENLLS